MSDDPWGKISRAQFDARTRRAYPQTTPYNVALEHWARKQSESEVLGVVVLDRVDQDFGFVALAPDERGVFCAIEVACSYPTIDKAREALRSTMRTIDNSRIVAARSSRVRGQAATTTRIRVKS